MQYERVGAEETKLLTRLVITRSRWLRGEGPSKSCLRRGEDGKMCCLGFYCVALGKSDLQITGMSEPDHVGVHGWLDQAHNEWALALSLVRGRVVDILMDGNDRIDTTETEREASLTTLFRKYGHIELVFVDDDATEMTNEVLV